MTGAAFLSEPPLFKSYKTYLPMSTISQQILRRILDAVADDNIATAEAAMEEYARIRSIAFLDWADRTPNSSLPKWDDNNELYDIFHELQND